MTFLSSNGLLRCACRAEKQLVSLNTSRTSTFTSQLSANFSSSAASLEDKPSTSASSSFVRSTGRNTSRPERLPYRAPESYLKGPSAQSISPLTAALQKTGGGVPSITASDKFGTKKRAEMKAAKEAGKKHAAEKAVAVPENAMPTTYEIHRPIKPSDSRTLEVEASGDFSRQYRRLMNGVIGFNNIRTELRWEERYEKPKYKRQRLRSARHRRRFAHEVGLRVAAVLRAKSQGM